MAKTYAVIKNQENNGERWNKRDFLARNIKRNLTNLDRVEITTHTNFTELVMVYKRSVRGGDGTIIDYTEEKFCYTKDNMSNNYFFSC